MLYFKGHVNPDLPFVYLVISKQKKLRQYSNSINVEGEHSGQFLTTTVLNVSNLAFKSPRLFFVGLGQWTAFEINFSFNEKVVLFCLRQ